jgi:hypothetical protein
LDSQRGFENRPGEGKGATTTHREKNMRHANIKWISRLLTILALYSLARNVSAGTYRTITIDGSFSDWTGVPVLATATNGTSGTNLDLSSLSIANDQSNIYLLITYNQPVNPNNPTNGPWVYLAFDTDNHPATGFNIFGLNLMGSEVGWQSDGPFPESNGVWNTGGAVSNGVALIAPYNSITLTQEYAISRFATYANGQPVFPGNTFTVAVYVSPSPNVDLLGPVQYTCATNVPSGTYKTITIDGSFSDWDGVPTLAWLPPGTSGTTLDLASLSMANDSSNLYLLLTYNTPVNPNAGPSVFLALDNDSNKTTGFDVYGLGLIGSEVGWDNDGPFVQSNGVYNVYGGVGVAGGVTNGNASIAPFYTVTTTQEYAIARSATFTSTGLPIFPNNTFNLMAFADPTPNYDLLGPVSYAFATNVQAGTYAQLISSVTSWPPDYSAWTNIPVVFTGDPSDGFPLGVRTIQMANDDNYVYIRLTYFMDVNPQLADGLYVALDADNDPATGFDIFSEGVLGCDVLWENDSAYDMSNGVWNTGLGITGGGALISPYDSVTSAQQYALPRAATHTATGAPVFPPNGSTIGIGVFTDVGTPNFFSGPIHYTLASGPSAPFRILSIARGGTNSITLTWTAPGGTTNVVQAKTGNYSTNGFVNISSSIINPGSASVAVTNQYTETLALTNRPARFYRVAQTP